MKYVKLKLGARNSKCQGVGEKAMLKQIFQLRKLFKGEAKMGKSFLCLLATFGALLGYTPYAIAGNDPAGIILFNLLPTSNGIADDLNILVAQIHCTVDLKKCSEIDDHVGKGVISDFTRTPSYQIDKRWITKKGNLIEIFALVSGVSDCPAIDVAEKDRSTRIATDFSTLVKLYIPSDATKKALSSTPKICSKKYVLENEVSTIEVKISNVNETAKKIAANLEVVAENKRKAVVKTDEERRDAEKAIEDAAGAVPEAANTNAAKATVIAGPMEHFYLSADAPVAKAVDLNSNGGIVGLKATPALFYISLNYMFGDVLTDDSQKQEGNCNHLSLKLLFQSDNPSNSLGVGVGWHGKILNQYLISPFVSVVWDKTSVSGTDASYSPRWIVGLSFDLNSALDWAKK